MNKVIQQLRQLEHDSLPTSPRDNCRIRHRALSQARALVEPEIALLEASISSLEERLAFEKKWNKELSNELHELRCDNNDADADAEYNEKYRQ